MYIHVCGVGGRHTCVCSVSSVGGIRVCAVCQVFAIYTSIYRSVRYIYIECIYIYMEWV